MADVKDAISRELVSEIGSSFAAASADFDRTRFEMLALDGLDEREFKARVSHVAAALIATLPADPVAADRVVRSTLAAGGLQSWASLAVTEFISTALLAHPAIGLPLLAALTSRFSAEFALRPFIETQPDETFAHLRAWVNDNDEHVRRLVSEGTRPRLPWAPQLRSFIADPTPTLALLDRLFDDESEYVRRSVANHLNDISKDHPDLAVEVAARWLAASTHGDYVARHALRSLVKKGHGGALAALGFGRSDGVEVVSLRCTPAALRIGEATTLTFNLRASAAVRAAIDYRVHYVGKNGPKAPKVFKLTTRDLVAGESIELSKRHGFEHVSIRTILPGPHVVDVQVNGCVLATTTVHVTA